jgi:hypothetical protein
MLRNSAINFVLKIGLGLSCIGFAIYSIAFPNVIIDFYPHFVPDIIGDMATLILGSLFAIFMAVWIFSRRQKFACASVFFIIFLVAILANITSLRFVSMIWPLLVISMALAIRYYPRVRIIVPHTGGERMRIVPIEPDEKKDGQGADRETSDDVGDADNTDNEDQLEDMILHRNKKDGAHANPQHAKPMPVAPEGNPAKLEEDPAKTNEFLNNEKFIRGHKFSESEEGRTAADNAETVSAIDMAPVHIPAIAPMEIAAKTTKAKRAYKPRAKKGSDSATMPLIASTAPATRATTAGKHNIQKRRHHRIRETAIDTGFSNSDTIELHDGI